MADLKPNAPPHPESSTLAMTSTLSPTSTLICWVLVPLGVAILIVVSPLTVCLLPILFSPTAWLIWKWRGLEESKRANLDTLVKVYFGIGTIGIATVMALQLAYCYATALLLFGSETQVYLDEFQRQSSSDSKNGTYADVTPLSRDLTGRPRYYVFVLNFCFVGAAFFEEFLKYSTLVLVRKFHPQQMQHPFQYLTFAMTAGLGFAAFENVGFVYGAVERGDSASKLALAITERLGFGISCHTMAALITAVQLARESLTGEKVGFVEAIWKSTALHGIGDFGFFMVSALQGVVGWRHPWDPVGLSSMYSVGAVVLYSTWSVLQRECQKHGIGKW